MNYEDRIESSIDFDSDDFQVDNDNLASWCLKVIKKETEETERLISIADSQIKELETKKADLKASLEKRTGYLKSKLFEYFNTVEHKETKTQESYKLLDGSLIFKKPAMKIVKPEEDTALIDYLEKNAPALVETVKKPAWGEFKKTLAVSDAGEVLDTNTGEILDFVKAEESEAVFDVKVV